MPGIYIHIPFCKQACHYCDFHFSTSLNNKATLIESIVKEIELRKDFFGVSRAAVETIYFGGGTPSLLSEKELKQIMDAIEKYFILSADVEITLEANPDDLTKEKIKMLRGMPVNRFSIGVQSFFEEDLKFMNRAHNAEEAEVSIKRVQDNGFENITIDLIYGTPTLTNKNWKKNLAKTFQLKVPHVSCYSLTAEERTALFHFIKTKQISPLSDQQSAEQFEILMKEMTEHNFLHYEISNFCLENFHSRHNSNYWKDIPYIGIGPSAHSYNGSRRFENIRNNQQYIRAIEQHKLAIEEETLSQEQQYNEYVLTSLRTMWGTDLNTVARKFGSDYKSILLKESRKYIDDKLLELKNEVLTLTPKGKLMADKIASDLFVVK